MFTEIVYNERDNSIDLLLKASTVNDPELKVVNLTNITRMRLLSSSKLDFDSVSDAGVFDWLTLATSGIVTIKLGLEDIPPKDVWRLVVYDSTNPDGVTWGDDFKILRKEEYPEPCIK